MFRVGRQRGPIQFELVAAESASYRLSPVRCRVNANKNSDVRRVNGLVVNAVTYDLPATCPIMRGSRACGSCWGVAKR